MRLDAAIADAKQRLSAHSDTARLDSEMLLCRAIDMPRSYLFAHPEDELDTLALGRFEALLARRENGEPMAYITGMREFWSMELQVSPATLIPRPETELLVDLALRQIPRDAACDVLDLGTGSGAIAMAIASERPLSNVVATDASQEALAIATANINAASLGNIHCLHGDWTAPVHERSFDVIVSNPPYVESGDKALSALRFEPQSALVSGADGLDDIRRLAVECGACLNERGHLLLEHGADQRAAVAHLLADADWTAITCHNDIAGRPRVTVARRGDK